MFDKIEHNFQTKHINPKTYFTPVGSIQSTKICIQKTFIQHQQTVDSIDPTENMTI